MSWWSYIAVGILAAFGVAGFLICMAVIVAVLRGEPTRPIEDMGPIDVSARFTRRRWKRWWRREQTRT